MYTTNLVSSTIFVILSVVILSCISKNENINKNTNKNSDPIVVIDAINISHFELTKPFDNKIFTLKKGIDLQKLNQLLQRRPRILYVNRLWIKRSLYAASLIKKIENTGQNLYPINTDVNKLSGQILMELSIFNDGTLLGARIRESSGNELLDNIAVKIAESASPFYPLPNDKKMDFDVLVLTVTWVFGIV